jgi:hypothetical protein
MEEYLDIVDQLDMLCCPRCMAVADATVTDWGLVIVDDVTDALDVVCPDCLTEYDLTRPDRDALLAEIDTDLRRMLGIEQ